MTYHCVDHLSILFRHLKSRTVGVGGGQELSMYQSFSDNRAFVNNCKYILRFVKRVTINLLFKLEIMVKTELNVEKI